MGRGSAGGQMPVGAGKRGLWRLMLRLPAMRGHLQMLDGKSDSFSSLCEAYEDASTALEGMLKDQANASPTIIEEYEAICQEIESDVIQYCVNHS